MRTRGRPKSVHGRASTGPWCSTVSLGRWKEARTIWRTSMNFAFVSLRQESKLERTGEVSPPQSSPFIRHRLLYTIRAFFGIGGTHNSHSEAHLEADMKFNDPSCKQTDKGRLVDRERGARNFGELPAITPFRAGLCIITPACQQVQTWNLLPKIFERASRLPPVSIFSNSGQQVTR